MGSPQEHRPGIERFLNQFPAGQDFNLVVRGRQVLEREKGNNLSDLSTASLILRNQAREGILAVAEYIYPSRIDRTKPPMVSYLNAFKGDKKTLVDNINTALVGSLIPVLEDTMQTGNIDFTLFSTNLRESFRQTPLPQVDIIRYQTRVDEFHLEYMKKLVEADKTLTSLIGFEKRDQNRDNVYVFNGIPQVLSKYIVGIIPADVCGQVLDVIVHIKPRLQELLGNIENRLTEEQKVRLRYYDWKIEQIEEELKKGK